MDDGWQSEVSGISTPARMQREINFHEWYEKNMQNTHRIFDHASRYLKEREEKQSAMNEKIRFIMKKVSAADILEFMPGTFSAQAATIPARAANAIQR